MKKEAVLPRGEVLKKSMFSRVRQALETTVGPTRESRLCCVFSGDAGPGDHCRANPGVSTLVFSRVTRATETTVGPVAVLSRVTRAMGAASRVKRFDCVFTGDAT